MDGIGEIGVIHGDDGFNCSFGEGTVSDFSATGATEGSGFTDRVGREVVEVHEALGFLFFIELVEDIGVLRILGHPEGENGHDLGLTAGEESGTVDAGEKTSDGFDGSKFVEFSPVWSLAIFDDGGAENFLDGLVDVSTEAGEEFGVIFFADFVFFLEFLFEGGLSGLADSFVFVEEGGGDGLAFLLHEFFEELFVGRF